MELADAGVGRRTGYKADDGSFLKVGGIETCVYIYEHKTEHAQCSQTHFSQIGGGIIINVTRGELEKCADKLHHYSLLPFFKDNEEVLKDYKHRSAPEDHGIKSDIVELQEIVDGKKRDKNTPFECSGQILYNWSENDWTKRLVTGLQKMLPNHNVTYTAEWGTQWDKNLLTHLGVKIGSANYFLFRGSPDIVIGNKHLANLGISGSTSNDSSSEDEIIENSHQRPPMQGASIFELPEKVGEVFGGLHILLVSKILKRIQKGKAIDSKYEVKGLLIDKLCGSILCVLKLEISEGESVMELCLTNYARGILKPSRLCTEVW